MSTYSKCPCLFGDDSQLAARVGLGELVGILDAGRQLDEVVGASLSGLVRVDERHAEGRRLPVHEVHCKWARGGDITDWSLEMCSSDWTSQSRPLSNELRS